MSASLRSSEGKSWFLGIDIGTGSCKSVVIDAQARVLGFGISPYRGDLGEGKWKEQDPEALVEATVSSAHSAVSLAIEQAGVYSGGCGAVSLGGAYHSLMAVDGRGNPMTGLITWVDGRAAQQARTVREEHDPEMIYRQTGCPVHAMYPAYKLIWLREERPEIFHQAARFITGKEYVLERLSGEYLVDYGIAAGSGMLNTHDLTWNDLSLSLAGIEPERLSPLCRPDHVIKQLNSEHARAIGIPKDTPLVVGSADAVNSSLGAGAVLRGQATCMIGTSGAFRIISDKPVLDQQARTWCYAIDHKHWLVGGAINNGGLAFSWFRETLNQVLGKTSGTANLSFEDMIELAGDVKPGADGLICLPFLAGERSPYWNMNARGVFFGLTLDHNISHFSRALLEGVAYRLRSVRDALLETGVEVERILASGGFTNSDLWLQIISSTMNRDLLVPEYGETSSLGTAFWALMGTGVINSFEDLADLVAISKTSRPQRDEAIIYEELYALYMDLYFRLGDSFDQIAKFQGEKNTPNFE